MIRIFAAQDFCKPEMELILFKPDVMKVFRSVNQETISAPAGLTAGPVRDIKVPAFSWININFILSDKPQESSSVGRSETGADLFRPQFLIVGINSQPLVGYGSSPLE